MAILLILVLVGGGVSILLARSIRESTVQIGDSSQKIKHIERIHFTAHHVIEAVHHAVISGQPYPEDLYPEILTSLNRQAEEYLQRLHQTSQRGDELRTMQQLAARIADLSVLSRRIIVSAESGGMATPAELEALKELGLIVHDKAEKITHIHLRNVTRSVRESSKQMEFITWIYLAFIGLGSLLLGAATFIFSKTVDTPIRKLASATLEVARGDFTKRVPVTSTDELGQLSHSFNIMAERLAEHERQLKATHEQLERKAQETEALYQIGMEISSLLPVDQVIEQVVSRCRELLQADRAGLALLEEGSEEIHWKIFLGGEEEVFKRIKLKPGQGVAGRVISEGRPVIIDDVSKGSAGAPEPNTILELEQLHSALAVPVRRGGHVVGALMVGTLSPSKFGDDQVRLLTGLGSQAAIAIENARLYEQTGALAALKERERLAREMHDSLAQTLAYLRLKILGVERLLRPEAGWEALESLEEMRKMAEDAYEDVRQAIFGLRTIVSRTLGLIPTLTEYLHEFSEQSEIPVELQMAQESAPRVSPAVEIQLIRIIQEALANVRKHAEAKRAWVRFEVEAGQVKVTIEDDGRGFDPEQVRDHKGLRFGIQTMRERVEGVGGTLEINTGPGKGTRVIARLPVS